jgi:hypothetical protein
VIKVSKKSRGVCKRPAGIIKDSQLNGKVLQPYRTPLKNCAYCKGKLFLYATQPQLTCTVVDGASITVVPTVMLQCSWRRCRAVHRMNYRWQGGSKLNCLTFEQMEQQGIYFVSDSYAFTMPYLHMTYLRLLRGKLAPGQEADVLQLFHPDDDRLPCVRTVRDNLLHALEGFAIARRQPGIVVPFDVNFPASTLGKSRGHLLFQTSVKVSSLCFDGHFGVNRVLQGGVDPPRTVQRRGRPRVKLYKEHERTSTCADKEKCRLHLPNRTSGWQFVLDPESRVCLGASEHLVNECLEDKVGLVCAVMTMPNVAPNLLIHDDACHFQNYVLKNFSAEFKGVKHYVVDRFHRHNHKCAKKKYTRSEDRRLKGVNTSIAEIFNAWMRPLNFFLNGLRPQSHRFWVEESILFYNAHVAPSNENVLCRRRTSAASRA